MPVVAKANAPAVTIRFPSKEVISRIKAEAVRSGRSFNSEVVFRLSQSLDAASMPTRGKRG